MLRCALFLSNQQFWGKKISKKISTSPSLKFAKNGRPEPLWSRGFSAQMLCALLLKAFTVVLPSKTCRAYLRLHAATCHYIAFLKGNFREVVLSYTSSYGSVQSSILRRIWCSTLVEQQMQRPAAKSNENCEGKKCAPQGARSSKKNSILYTHSFQKRAAAAAAAAVVPHQVHPLAPPKANSGPAPRPVFGTISVFVWSAHMDENDSNTVSYCFH